MCWQDTAGWANTPVPDSGAPQARQSEPRMAATMAGMARRSVEISTGEMPDVGRLLDLFHDWTPDAATRERILATNPAQLYGFPA
jgi:hypothetical protein